MTPAVRLSKREAVVLRWLCEGLSPKEVSYYLHLSESTLRWYLAGIRQRLGISDRADLCRWALQHPLAFHRRWVDARLHPLGCACGSDYCAAVRRAWSQIVAA